MKKGSVTTFREMGLRRNSVTTFSAMKQATTLSKAPLLQNEPQIAVVAGLVPCSSAISPNRSRDSMSLDESMSTCDSMKSPEFEYIDNVDSTAVASLERRASKSLHISENSGAEGWFSLSVYIIFLFFRNNDENMSFHCTF